jgi:hypothetical protein
MLLTLAVPAAHEKQKPVIPVAAIEFSDLPSDRPNNDRTFKLISLVAAIWAVIRRTMG